MLGDGVDKNGNGYWEMQDTSGPGDINNGDCGFLRFSRFPNVITEYVDIQVINIGQTNFQLMVR